MGTPPICHLLPVSGREIIALPVKLLLDFRRQQKYL
jgi:hypothetical protein